MKHTISALVIVLCLCLPGTLFAEPPLAPPAQKTTKPTKKSTQSKARTAKQPAAKSSSKDSRKDKVAVEPATQADSAVQDAPAGKASDKTADKAPEDKAAPETKADSPAKSQAKAAAKSASKTDEYEKWLEKYGAVDRLDKIYSTQDQESPEILLKRANLAMQTGAPQQALEILENSRQLEDKGLELQRLWLGGQAARAAGDPSKAVFWFSQAGSHLSSKEFAAKLQGEPGMDTIWADVWRRYFWIYSSNFAGTREGQQVVLQSTLDQAQVLWKNIGFWDAAAKALGNGPAPSGKSLTGDVTEVGATDRVLVAKALGAACLGYAEDAKADVAKISIEALREFWGSIVGYILTGEDPAELAKPHDSYPKASTFWPSNVMSRSESSRTDWILPEDDNPEWVELRQKNRSLPDSFKRYVEKDGGQGTLDALPVFGQYRLALAVAQGKEQAARNLWPTLDKGTLPLSLKLAAILLLDEQVDALLPQDPNAASRQFYLLSELASAGGAEPQRPFLAPFWIRLEGRQLNNASMKTWPLDRLMVLAEWTDRFTSKPTGEMAKRLAFLFPESETGAKATLQLAREAMEAKQYQLAGFYLANVESARLPRDLKAQQSELKGDLAFALGLFEDALRNYNDLIKTGVELQDSTRIKVAFILQQQGQLDVAQRQLEKLWERHEEMAPVMQAEILYYLAEGEHAMGNVDKALDYYLRLAWRYPKENIWALTAMFRAALIYDSQGSYDTAKNLLITVIKNAETEQQREAAKNRLTEIEAKMGRVEDKPKNAPMAYPF